MIKMQNLEKQQNLLKNECQCRKRLRKCRTPKEQFKKKNQITDLAVEGEIGLKIC